MIGVELNPDAVRDAKLNARQNRVENITFYQNDAGRFLVQMAQRGGKPDVLFMDPPRSGSSEEFLQAVAVVKPQKIIYVSCNPETLVRDLKQLEKSGWQVKRAVGVDLFPFTDATEAVCLLERRGIPEQRLHNVIHSAIV